MSIFTALTLPRTKTLPVAFWSFIHVFIHLSVLAGVTIGLALFGPRWPVTTAIAVGALASAALAGALEIPSIRTGSKDARADLPERLFPAVVTLVLLDLWFGVVAIVLTAGYWVYARNVHPDADKRR